MHHLGKLVVAGALLLAGVTALSRCAEGDKSRKRDQASEQKDSSAADSAPQVADANTQSDTTLCRPDGASIELPDIPEASGVAASVRTPGILWTHDDSEPILFAIDASGNMKGQVRVIGAKNNNWEDVSVARCSAGSCLYIADIGDNGGKRKNISVYRIPEPLPGDSVSDTAQVFHAKYPKSAEDAEGAWVTSKREVYIVTKGETGPISIYKFPPDARNGGTSKLKKIATLESGDIKRKEMITDADISADERWVVLRSDKTLMFYPAKDLESGKPKGAFRYDVSGLHEPQGEGVAFGSDGTVYLAGEGGGKGAHPGTFNVLRCQSPS